MEYKMFGPEGPPDDFREDLDAFLKLDEIQRRTLADWFLSTSDYEIYQSPLPPLIAKSTLLPEQFQHSAECIRFMLYVSQEYGLLPSDIAQDLLLLGHAQSDVAGILEFLDPLDGIKEKIWTFECTEARQSEGLPTLETISFLSDARAVFGGKKFLGLTPVVIMDVKSTDNREREQRMTVQMSEKQFVELRDVLEEALEQFAMLKEHIAEASHKGKGNTP